MADKFDLHAHVTNQIIRAMEAGTAPWRKPWTGATGGAAFPRRANGQPYQGINVVMLWLEAAEKGYSSAFWMTYKQAQELGGQVRKGEKSATVVKIGRFEKKNEETGEKEERGFARAYRVFNADQIEGLPEEFAGKPAEAPRDLGTEADPQLDAFFAATGARIETSDDPKAFYHLLKDHIHMPPIATFYSAAGYYGTLAHELTHWACGEKRLATQKAHANRKEYAFDELVAEIGACFLAVQLGVEPQFDQSAAYVEGWLEALKSDKEMIFKAAAEAQKAVDYINEKARVAEGEKQVAA